MARKSQRPESARSASGATFAIMAELADRMPPHSPEAEQGVLGCCLLDPKEALGLAVERIGIREAFYDGRHETIFRVLVEMVNTGKLIDPIVLQQTLRDRNQLEAIGGFEYLNGLTGCVPSAAVVEHYLTIVLEKYRLREMLRACQRGVLRVFDEQEKEATATISGIEAEVFAAGQELSGSTVTTAKEATHAVINLVEEHFTRGRGVIDGVPTGFSYLDKMLGGMHRGELLVIAARPSVGKTSLMMNIVEHVAVDGRTPVAVFSLEMRTTDLMMRLLCGRARVSMHKVRTGFMQERDIPRLTGAAGKVGNAPIFLNDTGSLEISVFRAMARRLKSQHKIGLVVVDYLQLMRDEATAERNGREREVASISANLKACAKELDVPVLALAQLNRETEKNASRKPTLADLRESGAIEQDADAVMLLYRPKVKKGEEPDGEEDEQCPTMPVNLLVAKQRNGPTGDCEFLFHKEFMRFEDKYGGTGSHGGEAKAREHLEQEPAERSARRDKVVKMPTNEELGLGK